MTKDKGLERVQSSEGLTLPLANPGLIPDTTYDYTNQEHEWVLSNISCDTNESKESQTKILLDTLVFCLNQMIYLTTGNVTISYLSRDLYNMVIPFSFWNKIGYSRQMFVLFLLIAK